jgi:MoxR-like ATPase
VEKRYFRLDLRHRSDFMIPMDTPSSVPPKSAEAWDQLQAHIHRIRTELGKVIVGQEKVVEAMMVALLCKGHCLVEGVPGLAKTLLVGTLGRVLGLSFRRIQFTPDLMPSDILGSELLQETEEGRRFTFVPGPIFAHVILADEINRTPPKTQAALLEAMQEKQVTVAGHTMSLEAPFVVFATQNPIEHEGTYPLPEAQLDRFFFNLVIDYPSPEEEREVMIRTARREQVAVEEVITREALLDLQNVIHEVPLPEHVLDAILKLVQSSRPGTPAADDYVNQYVGWGAGPRAAQCLCLATRALALLRGEGAASVKEVRDLAVPVLRHRIVPSYHATGEGIKVDAIINHLVKRLD